MRHGKKGLSPEDRELWDRVKRSAKPLDPPSLKESLDKSTRPAPAEKPSRQPDAAERLDIKPFRIGETSTMAGRHVPAEGPSADAARRVQQSTHRRLTRGKLKPEARIDLHGMTLADAHPALIRFVTDAWGRGLRLVLVITGKGRGGDDGGGPIPARRGVLRQQVPGWLSAPPLGALVLETREAHQRHGGGGAYYVYLRRNRHRT